MNIETLFDRVTPASLSGDLILTIVLVVGLSVYIWKNGVKNIVIFSVALYLGGFFADVFPWRVGSVGPLPGALVLFAGLTLLLNWVLHISPVGKTIIISKKPLWLNIVFGISVVGLVLSQVLQYMSLGGGTIGAFVEQSLFSREAFRIFWTVAPVIIYPFLKGSHRK